MKHAVVTLTNSAIEYPHIPVTKQFRDLFPDIDVPFKLEYPGGEITTYFTSRRTPDDSKGKYISEGISEVFDTLGKISPGTKLFIDVLVRMKHYRLRCEAKSHRTMIERKQEATSPPLVADDDAGSGNDTEYNPDGVDRRELVVRQIKARRGQVPFRSTLLDRYKSRCVVTGCQIVAILEAAHVQPYRKPEDNHPSNGLLLRADIHTLFDLNLLGIEPDQLRIELHPNIVDEYGRLAGKPLRCTPTTRPASTALSVRYKQFALRLRQSG